MKNRGRFVNLRFSIDVPIAQKTIAVQTGDYQNPPDETCMFHFEHISELDDLLDKIAKLRDDFYYEYL